MQKLITLCASLAFVSSLGLAGCKKKNGDASADKPAEGDLKKDDKAPATAGMPDKSATGSAAATAPAAAGDRAGPRARDGRAEPGVDPLHRLRRAARCAGRVVDRDGDARSDRLGAAIADVGRDDRPARIARDLRLLDREIGDRTRGLAVA